MRKTGVVPWKQKTWNKVKKIQINGRLYPCPWVGGINSINMSTLPKAICRCNANPPKIAMVFFLEQLTLKFTWNRGRPQMAQATREGTKREAGGGGYHAPCHPTTLQAVVIKTSGYRHTDRHTDQLMRIARKSVLAYAVSWPTTKEAGYTAGKDSVFMTWCWENWTTFLHRTQK